MNTTGYIVRFSLPQNTVSQNAEFPQTCAAYKGLFSCIKNLGFPPTLQCLVKVYPMYFFFNLYFVSSIPSSLWQCNTVLCTIVFHVLGCFLRNICKSRNRSGAEVYAYPMVCHFFHPCVSHFKPIFSLPLSFCYVIFVL